MLAFFIKGTAFFVFYILILLCTARLEITYWVMDHFSWFLVPFLVGSAIMLSAGVLFVLYGWLQFFANARKSHKK